MSAPEAQRVTVRVPATSANLGPGFDCIGLALDLWNETSVSIGDPRIEIEGEGKGSLPLYEGNLLVSSARRAFAHLGSCSVSLSFRCSNFIPCARGLGSSSASTVTGIAAAFAFAGKDIEDSAVRNEIFGLAADIEGHPDNAAPAVFGGCQIGIRTETASNSSHWITQQVDVADELKAVIFVPDFVMKTQEARGLLPAEIPRIDAVYNIGRAALLSFALSNSKWGLLRHATEDRLHQPLRIERLFPRFTPIAKGALQGGAHGVFLSGAGPAVLALATTRLMTICYEMTENARKAQIEGKAYILDLSTRGLQLSIHE